MSASATTRHAAVAPTMFAYGMKSFSSTVFLGQSVLLLYSEDLFRRKIFFFRQTNCFYRPLVLNRGLLLLSKVKSIKTFRVNLSFLFKISEFLSSTYSCKSHSCFYSMSLVLLLTKSCFSMLLIKVIHSWVRECMP